MNTHKLKIKSGPFAALASGAKTGEVRNCSDRNFQVGDTVELRLVDETGNPTGQEMHRRISHIQTGYGLPEEICVLSYEPLPSDAVAYEFEEARFCNLVDGVANYHGWIPRLTRDRPNMPEGSVRNIRPLSYSGVATTCPGHGRSECVSCCWPKGDAPSTINARIEELANLLTLAKAYVPVTDPLRGLIKANLMQHPQGPGS